MSEAAWLRPVAGPPREVEALLRRWLEDDDPPQLSVRTSGSTGAPKDVLLSAEALSASALATLARLGGRGRWVLALPVQQVAGLQVLVRSAIADTSPVVLADHGDLAAATAAVRNGADRAYVSIVPTQLHRWLESPPDVSALRKYDAVLVGGAAAGVGLLDRARAHGVRVVTTYGMTETSGGCVYDGVPLDGVGVALSREGEIRISGPVLFDGYAADPDLTSQVLRNNWFHTSDLGRLDLDGRLEVIGRSDDMVKSGGVGVILPQVERRIRELPGVTDCVVVGAPDAEWGHRVVAALVSAAGVAEPTLEVVRGWVSERHPRSWAPRQLVVVKALPMLAGGKPDRQRVIELANATARPS